MATSQLRPDVRAAALLAAITSTLMIAQQIASKSLRDALFLVHYPVSVLPVLMIGAAVLSFVMALAMGRLMRRSAPARIVPAMFVVSGVLYALEWLASGSFPRAVAIAVYAHTVTFGASVVSGFWSVINERFDPYVAKRVIGTIGAGATLGGLVGGLAVWQGVSLVPLEALLLALAFINALCGGLLYRVSRSSATAARTVDDASPVSLIGALRSTPYLRHIGLFVLLSALGTSLFDYVFKAQASVRFTDGDELVTFFALFYTLVGVATFLVQNTIVRVSLVRLGLTPTIGIMPALVFVFGLGAVVFPGFNSAALLRAFAATAENSFHRSAYELLYTPLSPDQKRSTKLLIDVGADRAGTALGSGIALVCLAWFAGAELVMLMLAAGLAACILGALFRLNRGYVHALATSMRKGAMRLDPDRGDAAVDAETARRALARTMADFDLSEVIGVRTEGGSASTSSSPVSGVTAEQLREAVIARCETRAKQRRSNALGPPTASSSPASLSTGGQDRQAVRESGFEESDDGTTGIVPADDLAMVGRLLPLIGNPDRENDAEAIVRRHAPRAVGQLVDALLSPRFDQTARGRIAHILADVPTRRASFGLQLGLEESSFEISHACAVGLYRMCRDAPSLAPTPNRLFDIVLGELTRVTPRRDAYEWPSDLPESPFFAAARGNVSMRLVHAFTLLGLYCEREPLMLAFRSLQSDDDGVRGTALEYLENVLPSEVRRALWRHVDTGSALSRPRRIDTTIAAELAQALKRRELSLREMRKGYRDRLAAGSRRS